MKQKKNNRKSDIKFQILECLSLHGPIDSFWEVKILNNNFLYAIHVTTQKLTE